MLQISQTYDSKENLLLHENDDVLLKPWAIAW